MEEQAKVHLQSLQDELSLPQRPFGVLFRRGTTRAYIILPNQAHGDVLLERTRALVQKWGKDETGKRSPKPHFTGPIMI